MLPLTHATLPVTTYQYNYSCNRPGTDLPPLQGAVFDPVFIALVTERVFILMVAATLKCVFERRAPGVLLPVDLVTLFLRISAKGI